MTLRSARRRIAGAAVWLGLVALGPGLAGCEHPVEAPIEAFRSLSGFNKNDPDPATAPYTVNLEQAEKGPYPNLASVPPLPVVATTLDERQKLAEKLTQQRTSTEASDTHGPGTAAEGAVPPPPEIPPSLAVPQLAAVPPPTAPPATPLPKSRPMDEPPPPAPLESTMQTPAIGNLPGAEATRSAPQEGHPSAMPRPAPSALPPAATQSGNPQPAPALAVLPPPQVSPQVAALPPPKLPPTPTVVAALDLPAGAIALPSNDARLAQIAQQYKEKPRVVRVVAFVAPGVGSAEQLNAFRNALDRAQAIARQLSDAGIPAAKIQTQAAPAGANAPAGRIEVQLLQ